MTPAETWRRNAETMVESMRPVELEPTPEPARPDLGAEWPVPLLAGLVAALALWTLADIAPTFRLKGGASLLALPLFALGAAASAHLFRLHYRSESR